MKIVFTEDAKADYEFWIRNDPKRTKRIDALCEDMRQNPFKGIGKPEPLRFNFEGKWSRRIDKEHRIIYFVEKGIITVIACRYHY